MNRIIEPGIFKAYDVRGIYPTTLNEEIAERIGKAYVTLTKAKTVVIAQDMRPSGEILKPALIKGVQAMGASVIEIGLASTDLFYFAVHHLKTDGGIMVTASHNPKQYNGFKMVREHAVPIGEGSGMEQIRDLVFGNAFVPIHARKPTQSTAAVLNAFTDFIFSFVAPSAIAPLKVVLDAGNGMACVVAPHILKRMKLEEIRQCFELDGNFPNHEANPLVEENRRDVIARVIAEKADLGIAWDGDADRCFFIDNRGRFVAGDFITGVIAERMLRQHPQGTVMFDVRSSRFVSDRITAAGGKPKMLRVGHAFFKHAMREGHAIFGGEVSGHYYYHDQQQFFADNGYIPALQILELVSELKRSGTTLAAFLDRALQGYCISGEINSRVKNSDEILRKLAAVFADGKLYYLDGLSVEYPDWHFNVRVSNTEPLLRLNLEATSQEKMEHMREQILSIIRGTS